MKLSKFSEQDDVTCSQERSRGEIMTPKKKWLKSISINLTQRNQPNLQQKYFH